MMMPQKGEISAALLALFTIANIVVSMPMVESGATASNGSIIEPLYTSHEPCRIDSDADFQVSTCVTAGDGSSAAPYVIEGWDLNGTGHGYALYIGNTTKYFTIRDNTLHNATGKLGVAYFDDTGLYLRNANNGSVQNNNVFGNRNGLYLYLASHNDITDNNVSNNSNNGFHLYSSKYNNLTGNTASDNGGRGFSISSTSPSNNFTGNKALGNVYGFDISSSYNYLTNNNASGNSNCGMCLSVPGGGNIIYYSNIYNNAYGIYLFQSHGNTFRWNMIESNTNYGVFVGQGLSNLIYQNTFINNHGGTLQAFDLTTSNLWDNGYGKGNYWSDFDTPSEGCWDNDTDGICDAPYLIAGSAGAKDYYPFTTPTVHEFREGAMVLLLMIIGVPLTYLTRIKSKGKLRSAR